MRLERLPRVTAQYLRCVPVFKIAAAEKVTPKAIYRDLAFARKVWERQAGANMQKHIAKELAKLDEIEREAWSCHEQQKNKLYSVRKTFDVKEGATASDVSKEILKKTPQVSATWMQVILNCMDRRAKLLRLDSDEHNHAGVMQATIIEVVVDTPEQVNQIISYNQFQALANTTVDEPETGG